MCKPSPVAVWNSESDSCTTAWNVKL
jgi:hypothetical protein